jgi:hypothetical protein
MRKLKIISNSMRKLIFAGIILALVPISLYRFVVLIYRELPRIEFFEMWIDSMELAFVFFSISTPFLSTFSIFLAILPVKLYKKILIQRISDFFIFIIPLVFLHSVSLILSSAITPSPFGWEESWEESLFSFLFGLSGLPSGLAFFFILRKLQRAIKEIKEESHQQDTNLNHYSSRIKYW